MGDRYAALDEKSHLSNKPKTLVELLVNNTNNGRMALNILE
jgi:hypothetical protein